MRGMRILIPIIILIPFIIVMAALGLACNRGASNVDSEGQISLPALPDDIPALVTMLGEANQPRRNEIMDKLVAKGEEAIPALIASMSQEGEPQTSASNTLAMIGEPAIPALIEALASEDYYTRYGAIMALGQIGAPSIDAIEPLVSLFRRTVIKTEQIAIMHSAEKIDHGESVVNMVVAALVVDDLRFDALRVLADLGPSAVSAVTSILPFLQHENSQTRVEALQALEGIGPAENVVDKIDDMFTVPEQEDRVKTKAAQVLGSFGEAAAGATTALAALLTDPIADTQRAAAKALGQIAPASRAAIPALITALSSTEAQTRREAAWALGQFGTEASSALTELRRVSESDTMDYVRTSATEAIAAIEGGQPDAIETVNEAETEVEPEAETEAETEAEATTE